MFVTISSRCYFTVCDFLQSWVCAWKAWFQDAKITAHRPEKTWAVIFNNQIISGEPSSVAPFLFIILASLHFYVNFLYKISFALWHATECPLAFFCLFLFHSGFFKRFIDNFYPVLLIGILYNFIAFQNPLSFFIVHLNKTWKKRGSTSIVKPRSCFLLLFHFQNILYDNIIRSFANSPPLTSSNFASRSATFRFFFSSPDTS